MSEGKKRDVSRSILKTFMVILGLLDEFNTSET